MSRHGIYALLLLVIRSKPLACVVCGGSGAPATPPHDASAAPVAFPPASLPGEGGRQSDDNHNADTVPKSSASVPPIVAVLRISAAHDTSKLPALRVESDTPLARNTTLLPRYTGPSPVGVPGL